MATVKLGLDVANATLASGIELSGGGIQLARQNSLYEPTGGNSPPTGWQTTINSNGGVFSEALVPGELTMRCGSTVLSDLGEFTVASIPSKTTVAVKGGFGRIGPAAVRIGVVKGYDATQSTYRKYTDTSANPNYAGIYGTFFGIYQETAGASWTLQTFTIDNGVLGSVTYTTITPANMHFPIWLETRNSGDTWQYWYKTNSGSWTQIGGDLTLAGVTSPWILLTNALGNHNGQIAWIRNRDTSAFLTTSPIATFPAETAAGTLDPSTAQLTVLQFADPDGPWSTLAESSDRLTIAYRDGAGGYSSEYTVAAFKAITPPISFATGPQFRVTFVSDGTQQIKLIDPCVGTWTPAFDTVTEAARNTDPGVGNVKNAVTYKILNADKTGTLVSTDPGVANVVKDVAYTIESSAKVGTFDESSRNTDPGIVNVINGTSYKILNVSKTGTFDESARNTSPGVTHVESGVTWLLLNVLQTGTQSIAPPDKPTVGDATASGSTVTIDVTPSSGNYAICELIQSSTGELLATTRVENNQAIYYGVTAGTTCHGRAYCVNSVGLYSPPADSANVMVVSGTSTFKAILDQCESLVEDLFSDWDTKKIDVAWSPAYIPEISYPCCIISPGEEPDDVPDRTNAEFDKIFPVRIWLVDHAHGKTANMESMLLAREQLEAMFKMRHQLHEISGVYDVQVEPFGVVNDAELADRKLIVTGVLLRVHTYAVRG